MTALIIALAAVLVFVILFSYVSENRHLKERNKQLEDWVAHDRKRRMAEGNELLNQLFH